MKFRPIKFGGTKHSFHDLRELIQAANAAGDSLDNIVGDDAFSCQVVTQLLDQIQECIKEQKEKK